MAAANTLLNLQEEATCSICLGHFTDPVITPCGHNFCRGCIEGCLEGAAAAAPCCPQCREPCSRAELRPNRQLQSMVELVSQLSVQLGAPPRGEGFCEQHEEKLKLFCQDDNKLICVICQVSSEHKRHRVSPINEAAKEYQGKLQEWLAPLKKEINAILLSKQKEEKEYTSMRKNVEAEKTKTAAEFERLRQLLREQEETILKRLEEMDRKITKVEDANIDKLSSQISSLDALIKEIETKCKQPPEELLKNVGLTLSRCENVRFHEPKLEMMKTKTNIQKFKLPKFHSPSGKPDFSATRLIPRLALWKYKAVVTLDSETAYERLVLSENERRVTYSLPPCKNQKCRVYSGKRFTASLCVLGKEGFCSGKHYWEVELLQERLGWTVGVAQESINRTCVAQLLKEQPCISFSHNGNPGSFNQVLTESPKEGIWAVQRTNDQYFALTSPYTPLKPCQPPKKLGVYLDYEGKQVSLYNSETMELLYTFSGASFNGRVYPYFTLCGMPDAVSLPLGSTDLRLV